MPVSTHKKRQRVKFPLNLSFGEIQNIQAIDHPTETGNFCLSNLEYRNFFFVESTVESGILGRGSRRLESGIPSVESRIQDCLVLYFYLISSIQQSLFPFRVRVTGVL